MERSMYEGIVAGAGATTAAAAVLFYVGRMIFRRVVRDGLETAKDRAEADYVTGVVAENEKLRARHDDMANKYTEAMRQVGELTGKVEAQTATINRLEAQVSQLQTAVEERNARIDRLLDLLEMTTP